ncbi:MAG: hypothetical protein O3C05_03245 [Proteobacteria bacterium]|nr:hypothetical protein [Pseudomonadota bacterium]
MQIDDAIDNAIVQQEIEQMLLNMKDIAQLEIQNLQELYNQEVYINSDIKKLMESALSSYVRENSNNIYEPNNDIKKFSSVLYNMQKWLESIKPDALDKAFSDLEMHLNEKDIAEHFKNSEGMKNWLQEIQKK